MQKRAFLKKKQYETVFSPLPIEADATLYYDKTSVFLPYAEDFPKLHYHDRYEIGICEAGEGLFLSEGNFTSVSKGDLIFVAPKSRHYSRSLHADALCHCRFVYLRAEEIDEILQIGNEEEKVRFQMSLTRIPTVIRPNEYPTAAALLSEITALCQESVPHRDRLAILRLATFLLESERWFPRIEDLTLEEHPICREPHLEAAKIAEYLSLHYFESQTAKELAAMCHLSESQLRRQFLGSYGIPPIAYRNFLRCNIASELLCRTDLSIAEISEQLGYSSPSDFYRQFQKHHKISPSEYRKKCARYEVF